MPTVVGIDSSTQSTKVLACDADSGAVLAQGRADHVDATEVDPAHWWDALGTAAGRLIDGAAAVAVAGQQHGMVVLDENGAVLRPALLWNDTRSAGAATELVEELGGPQAWADAVGSVPVASFTVTKLRWLARHEPLIAKRVHDVVLPHDFLTRHLCADAQRWTTDRGDASGTGYWSAADNAYRDDLLALALGRTVGVPHVAEPRDVVGTALGGALVAPGTGDNMAAALGLGLAPGDVVVSLGTSGTAFAVHDEPTSDPTGQVAGFADATGRYLPLVCTLNAARVLTAAATMIGVDLAALDRLAMEAEPGAGGLVLLPYLDGERTPDLPLSSGSVLGMRRANMTPANVARAAVEGMLCGLADAVDALRAMDVPVRRVLLIGGAAASGAVRAMAGEIIGAPVSVPEPAEYVARGAARQAAWALSGASAPPDWSSSTHVMSAQPQSAADALAQRDTGSAGPTGGWGQAVRDQYGDQQRSLYGRNPSGVAN